MKHTIEVMELGIKLLPLLPVKVDTSLLLTAGFLHDVGKIDTHTDHAPYTLTPLGKAWGHQVLGLRYLLPLLEQTDSLSLELGGRLLSTLRLIPSSHTSPIPPEQEVLVTKGQGALDRDCRLLFYRLGSGADAHRGATLHHRDGQALWPSTLRRVFLFGTASLALGSPQGLSSWDCLLPHLWDVGSGWGKV